MSIDPKVDMRMQIGATNIVPEDNEEPDLIDLTLENLAHPEVIGQLGVIAAKLLASAGTATFMVTHDGFVIYINPASVAILQQELIPPPGKVARFVRPVVSDGRPQFVAMREDGQLWEVEYSDDEGEEDAETEGA